MNKIILIEDRQDFADGFITEAKSKNIDVAHKRSFEGLKDLLPRYSTKFAAVVLDIKCLLEENSPKEESAFIGAAMQYLDQKVPNFPRFILTGDEKEFEKLRSFYKNEKIFLKKPEDIAELYKHLNVCIEISEHLSVRRLYPEIFDCFEKGLLPANSEDQLMKIIQSGLREVDSINFKGVLAEIRSYQETVFKSINARRKDVVPDDFIKPRDGMIKFNDLMNHLNGNPNSKGIATQVAFQNGAIYKFNDMLYRVCSEYVHDDPRRTYNISHFTLRSTTNGLLEVILWSKQYV